MSDLFYNEGSVIEELEQLPLQLRVAFAATCVERLLPAYEEYSKRLEGTVSRELNSILERLWADLGGQVMTPAEIENAIENCMSAIQSLNSSDWVEGQEAADDAVAALCYALRCRKTGDPQEAAWAARRLYEALDNFIINHDHLDIDQPGIESRVVAHPLIQAELARQRRDVEELLEIDELSIPSVLVQLRERAKAEARIFFGSAS